MSFWHKVKDRVAWVMIVIALFILLIPATLSMLIIWLAWKVEDGVHYEEDDD